MEPQFVKDFAANWPWLVIAVIIVWPTVHFLYKRQITLLQEDVNRLRRRVEENMLPSAEVRAHAAVSASPPNPAPSTPGMATSPQGAVGTYPTWLKALPPVPPAKRTVLSSKAIDEITLAYNALPPLDRKSGIQAAYEGKWIESEGRIREIETGFEVYQVLVTTVDDNYVRLTYPQDQRAIVSALREGQHIRFSGQIHRAGDGSVELIHVTLLS